MINWAAVSWLVVFGAWVIVWVWAFFSTDPGIWITKRDLELMAPIVDNRQAWLTPTMQAINEIGSHWAPAVLGWVTIAGGLLTRRIRHVLLLLASLSLVAGAMILFTNMEIAGVRALRPRPLGMTQIGQWDGFAHPSRVAGFLAVEIVAIGLTLLPPGVRRRRWWILSAVLLAGFVLAQLYTGVEHPSDLLAGATVGFAVALFSYRLVAPETVFPIAYRTGKTAHLDVSGARGRAIRVAIRNQLGIEVREVMPIGLAGSAGSTPLRIVGEGADGSIELFAKLYAQSHLRSDRWYKLARTLIYGRLEDETRFTSVRRLVQYEHYMLQLMKECGVPSAEPYGVVEITPEREYLLVSEFLDDAVEISDTDLTDDMIDEALSIVAQLWRSGVAHRDIKPANLMVQDSHVRVIDVAFGQIRPSPWRQAVDLANMMLVLALQSTPEHVYQRACLQFSEDEIAEAFAATRGVTVPTALRSEVRHDGRSLIERFGELAPSRRRVTIQRWTWRRVGLTAWVGLLVTVAGVLFVRNLDTIGLTPSAEPPAGTIRPPYCQQPGSDLIVAQSVPSAEIIPCLGSLPPGWTVSTTSVDQDGTVVEFDSDRAGPGAAVLHFDESCDRSGATATPTDNSPIDRFDRVDDREPGYTASWYSVVEGGCWWWNFRFTAGTSATFAVEIDSAVQARTRSEINAALAATFIDEPL
ncbi:MAG: phosphatase PAP2 family protein [Acidimicrobiales bacterium]